LRWGGVNLLYRTSQGTDAADVLRFSTRTLREYVSQGEIEGRIIGAGKSRLLHTITKSISGDHVTID